MGSKTIYKVETSLWILLPSTDGQQNYLQGRYYISSVYCAYMSI